MNYHKLYPDYITDFTEIIKHHFQVQLEQLLSCYHYKAPRIEAMWAYLWKQKIASQELVSPEIIWSPISLHPSLWQRLYLDTRQPPLAFKTIKVAIQ
jgi:hypothetical protein